MYCQRKLYSCIDCTLHQLDLPCNTFVCFHWFLVVFNTTGTLHIMLKICSELLVYSIKISFALMLVNSHVIARPRPFNAPTPFSTFEPLLSPPSAAAAHWSDISLDSKAAIPPQAKNFKHSISQSTGRGGEILTRHKRVPQGEDT